jgi:hypothetical protein
MLITVLGMLVLGIIPMVAIIAAFEMAVKRIDRQ